MDLLSDAGPFGPPAPPCPACAEPFPPASPERPACGISLSGPAADELWQVDQQLVALRRRRELLLTELRAASGPSVGPAPGRGPRTRASGVGVRRGRPAQQVLLGVGALLVVVAASVFLAVAWNVLGVGLQVAVMAALTAVVGGLSVVLGRRGLRASAEAAAVVAVALATLDAAAARWLDLAGLGRVDPWDYATCVAASLALVLVVVSPPVLKGTALTYRVAAVLAATAAPLMGLVATDARGVVAVLTTAVVAALAGVGSRRLTGGWAGYRRPLGVVFGGYLTLTWLLAPLVGLDEPGFGEGGASRLVALAVAIGAAWAADLHHGLRRATENHAALAGAALLGVTVQVAALAAQGGLVPTALAAVVGAVVAAALAGRSVDLLGTRRGVAAAAAQLVSFGTLLVLTTTTIGSAGGASRSALATALAGACLSATFATRSPRLERWASGWAATTGVAAVAVATAPLGLAATAYAMTAAVLVLVAVVVVRRGVELVVGRVAVVAGLVTIGLAAAAGPGASGLPPLVPVLAVLGLTALAYGLRPQRDVVSWVGVLLCSAANGVHLWTGDVAVVEAYSLPLAVLALGVGLVRLRRRPASPSWLTVGPAAGAGLLPSAFATLDDASLTRTLLVLVAAAAVMVVGVRLRWQAPLLSGALAAGVVAVAQLAPYAVEVPRWVGLGTVGAVLLVLGFRYEQRRRDAASLARWVAALR